MSTGADAGRRAELERSLTQVGERIERACADTGRDPADLTLIVVTKRFPLEDVLALHELGVRDIGENRDQEAGEKVMALRDRLGADAPTVHFIGQLQSNKAGHVAGYADVVQSADRAKIVDALARGAQAAGRELDVLVQVGLDADEGRGGVRPDAAGALADRVAGLDGLRLRGVMAVAPLGADPAPAFARLREVADGIRSNHPDAHWISAGMSGDLEAAVAHGATHLRVGTAILGSRTAVL